MGEQGPKPLNPHPACEGEEDTKNSMVSMPYIMCPWAPIWSTLGAQCIPNGHIM